MKAVLKFLIVLLFVIFVQCGNKNPEFVLKAGDQILDGETLIFYYKQSGLYTDKKEVTSRQVITFAEKYLEKNLLYQAEGYALNLDQDTVVIHQQKVARQKIMTQGKGVLQQHLVPKNIKATENEILEYYDHLDTQVHIAYIQLKSAKKADSVYALLQRGADFGTLASEHSTDSRTSANGGDLGQYTLWGYVGLAIDSVAFKLARDEISRPVNTYMGHYLVKLIDRKKISRGPLDSLRISIENKIKSIKTGDWTEKYLENLTTKYSLQVHQDALPLVGEMYVENNGVPILDVSKLDVPSLQKTIVTHKKGAWNILNFVQVFNSTPRHLRHSLKTKDQITDFTKKSISQELLYFEALELGLDKYPEYLFLVNLNDNALVARRSKEVLVNEAIKFEEEELKTYYETNKLKFRNQPYEQVKNRVQNLVMADKIAEKENEVLIKLRSKYTFEMNEKEITRLVEELNEENRKAVLAG
jgi:hypothetical protein